MKYINNFQCGQSIYSKLVYIMLWKGLVEIKIQTFQFLALINLSKSYFLCHQRGVTEQASLKEIKLEEKILK